MIYLDNNATTAIHPDVVSAMSVIDLANPSSPHRFGQKARQHLLSAKRTILERLAPGREMLFTSGATEALNMVIQKTKGHIITSSMEHAAVLEACKNKKVTFLDPDRGKGSISCDQVKRAVTEETELIVLMAANNETGVLTDLQPIADLGIPLLIDGVALLGKSEWTMPTGVVAVTFSSHKIHGPAGVGCLIYDRGFPIKPLILGGGQEKGLRAGTENVAGIVGFSKAVELLDRGNILHLRSDFERRLPQHAVIHGSDQPRVDNTSLVAFPGIDGEELLVKLDLSGIAVSYGSACSSGALQNSHVLQAMGVSYELIRSTLRFSFSRFTTQQEIDCVVAQLSKLLTKSDLTPTRLVSSALNSN